MKSGIFILIFVQVIVIGESQPIENRGIDLSAFSSNYHSLPFIDLNHKNDWQTVVDQEDGQYLGHPTTVLLDDGKTIYCVYPKGHGRGPIVMKRSLDGGLTWSERLQVPDNWASSLEVPTLYPVTDVSGQDRVIMFSRLYPARMAYSEDDCQTWTPLQPLGTWGGIVVMGDLISLNTGAGHYLALFHDDERFFSGAGRSSTSQKAVAANQPSFTLYKTLSYDGGMTWSYPQNVYSSSIIHLCEPGLIRAPDGKQIAMLLRENSRRLNSFIMFSDDEGKTWSPPRELPNALTGDRHQVIYTDDGRLLISFRDLSPALARFNQLKEECKTCDEKILAAKAGPVSPTAGDWVGWIGTYEDLLEGNEGQYRLRFKDNTKGSDCAYPALELLPDGHIVATTYGYWQDEEEPYVLSFRFKMQELDKMAPGKSN